MAEVNVFKALIMVVLSSFLPSSFVLGADTHCSITNYGNNTDTYDVYCNQVPMADIKKQFNDRPTIKINYLDLTVQSGGDFIPADLLGQSQLTYTLFIAGSSLKPSLSVDRNAFRASRNSTLRSVGITQLQGASLDFGFLAGFDNVSYLGITYIENLNPATLPSLPSLNYLSIIYSTGINEAFQDISGNFVLETNQGLGIFDAYGCDLDTYGLANLLDWIFPSSAETLFYLNIPFNYFSSIPRQMSSFQSIKNLYINGNRQSLTIGNNTIHCNGCLYLDIESSNITSVESNAFQGNYSSAQVGLSKNCLTRFEEGAFKSMLEDMSLIDATGFLDVGNNPFDCYSDQCQHLNWLILDNRHLLDKLKNARCILDDTAFEDLSQSLCKSSGIASTSGKLISNMFFSFLIPVSVLALKSLFFFKSRYKSLVYAPINLN